MAADTTMATAPAFNNRPQLHPSGPLQWRQRHGVSQRLTAYEYQQPRQPYNSNQGYMPNGAPGAHPNLPLQATPLLPNQGRVIQTGPIRILCIADVRGMSPRPDMHPRPPTCSMY